MDREMPEELQPEDLPDDPETLKRLVCGLYEAVQASEALIESPEGVGAVGVDEEKGLGWLTTHLEAGGPAGPEPGLDDAVGDAGDSER
jgi:hypothetical protein